MAVIASRMREYIVGEAQRAWVVQERYLSKRTLHFTNDQVYWDPYTTCSTAEIMVTNDGATILKSISLDNAAAKVLVNISKVQDDEVGDGTTSVTVLAAELLREAEKLVDIDSSVTERLGRRTAYELERVPRSLSQTGAPSFHRLYLDSAGLLTWRDKRV
ncbi:hypothetical protein B0T21DRAFT_417203 [Apiosordaria backusii]|uniref:T-complex protein 1 subunit alpha n=1 Tax=Apiosordaria backusii TaxID=314023 RepID=A0AA39ZPS3_9PEZI|nr:hypothetical protein B0T21DRAFT_417203 [Apiosordaria backusii]